MIRTLNPGKLQGIVQAIPSKSQAHRLLICAALADTPSTIRCSGMSRDILATMECLRAMGTVITADGDLLQITPIRTVTSACCHLPCRESGSTLRFLLPVAGALGLNACFHMEGRLPQRPMGPLTEVLEQHGMTIRQDGNLLYCEGQLQPGTFSIPGNISSQYISGLLFALPLLDGDSVLQITTGIESGSYIAMIPGSQHPRFSEGCSVEGDWSNAAFFLCAGAISAPVTITGLRMESTQGDKSVLDILRRFGADVQINGTAVTVSPAPLQGISIDAAEIPDLIPVLCAVAAAASGDTVIQNAARLRLKESDRLAATANLIRDLGGSIRELPDGLIVTGTGRLTGGTVDAVGDHRMAMTAAVCSLICSEPVTIPHAECTEKSYPAFWQDFEALRKEP